VRSRMPEPRDAAVERTGMYLQRVLEQSNHFYGAYRTMNVSVVIIGTGLAGYNLAREIRKQDKTIKLTLVTQDDGTFYSKPMLSNALAKNKNANDLAMADAQKMQADLDATIITNTTVTRIDTANKTLVLDDTTLTYDKLVLALGATPIIVPVAGNPVNDILTINNLQDYHQFRQQLTGKKSVAIIGPGLIGCEFANDLIDAGYDVSVIGPDETPLGRLVPRETGLALQQALQSKGVHWFLQTTLTQIDKSDDAYSLTLSNGSTVNAALVLSAIGLRANTALAAEAGLNCDRGITVDRQLRTSNADIYALGDCAQVQGLLLPYILPLMQCVRALALTLTGTLTKVSYPAMPVLVKTPAYPLVVAPPAQADTGQWHVDITATGSKALFKSGDALRGFALGGDAVNEKQALTKSLPVLLTD
jgi:rubredoxin-NAD+ reductase